MYFNYYGLWIAVGFLFNCGFIPRVTCIFGYICGTEFNISVCSFVWTSNKMIKGNHFIGSSTIFVAGFFEKYFQFFKSPGFWKLGKTCVIVRLTLMSCNYLTTYSSHVESSIPNVKPCLYSKYSFLFKAS